MQNAKESALPTMESVSGCSMMMSAIFVARGASLDFVPHLVPA
jgi:hypothetical protein